VEITGKRYVGKDWRKLLSSRRGTILVAAACVLIAGAIIVFAMHRYRQSVNAQGQLETVLVATQLIQKGTTGDAIARGNLFHPTQIVAKQVSAGAITDTAAITGKVTAVNIYPGQQLTLADFASTGDLAAQLGPNDRALSIPLPQGPGLVGQLQAGDHVDVYGGWTVLNEQGRSVPLTKLLVPDATVLKAANAPISGGIGGSSTSQISDVVIKVNVADAAKIAFTSTNGTVWLVLRSPTATAPSATQITSIDSILFGIKPIPTKLGA
jgi:Flp pilus assembly protein CpaB